MISNEMGAAPGAGSNEHDAEYAVYLERLSARLAERQLAPLFTTDCGDLFDWYLRGFEDPAERQYHTCSACRSFINRYGGLVTIDEQGYAHSALWSVDDAPERYKDAAQIMLGIISKSKVTGVFLSALPTLGTPQTGPWSHLSARNPRPYEGKLKKAHEAVAEKREDTNQVLRALAEFPLPMLEQVVEMLQLDTLCRGEKVLGPAAWLRDVQRAVQGVGGRRRNVVLRAVATAPSGFCHPRSSMIGTLLDDLLSGSSFDDAAARFKKKMHPLSYQRPQAAPSVGQIEAAEKVVEKLGIAESLKRRFARLEDIPEFLWRALGEEPKAQGGGVFGHLKPAAPGSVPLESGAAITTSWKKFESTVLPLAVRVEARVSDARNFFGLTTAVVPDALPILQWDRPERRNPVSWYVYSGGSSAHEWGLTAAWCDVAAVTSKPDAWHGAALAHHYEGALLVLPQAKDIRAHGLALFPETLRAELHGARAVIERFSREGRLEGAEEATANGLMLAKSDGGFAGATLRVTLASGAKATYRIGSWD